MSVITARDVEGATGVLAVGVKDVITPLAADRPRSLASASSGRRGRRSRRPRQKPSGLRRRPQ
jgi:hypothetical protein